MKTRLIRLATDRSQSRRCIIKKTLNIEALSTRLLRLKSASVTSLTFLDGSVCSPDSAALDTTAQSLVSRAVSHTHKTQSTHMSSLDMTCTCTHMRLHDSRNTHTHARATFFVQSLLINRFLTYVHQYLAGRQG